MLTDWKKLTGIHNITGMNHFKVIILHKITVGPEMCFLCYVPCSLLILGWTEHYLHPFPSIQGTTCHITWTLLLPTHTWTTKMGAASPTEMSRIQPTATWRKKNLKTGSDTQKLCSKLIHSTPNIITRFRICPYAHRFAEHPIICSCRKGPHCPVSEHWARHHIALNFF